MHKFMTGGLIACGLMSVCFLADAQERDPERNEALRDREGEFRQLEAERREFDRDRHHPERDRIFEHRKRVQQIESLREAAERLHNIGRHEVAEDLMREAQELQADLERERREGPHEEFPHHEATRMMAKEIHHLREEVAGLRKEMTELKMVLFRLIDQKADGRPPVRERDRDGDRPSPERDRPDRPAE